MSICWLPWYLFLLFVKVILFIALVLAWNHVRNPISASSRIQQQCNTVCVMAIISITCNIAPLKGHEHGKKTDMAPDVPSKVAVKCITNDAFFHHSKPFVCFMMQYPVHCHAHTAADRAETSHMAVFPFSSSLSSCVLFSLSSWKGDGWRLSGAKNTCYQLSSSFSTFRLPWASLKAE